MSDAPASADSLSSEHAYGSPVRRILIKTALHVTAPHEEVEDGRALDEGGRALPTTMTRPAIIHVSSRGKSRERFCVHREIPR